MNICVWSSQEIVPDCEDVGSAIYVKYPRVFSTTAQNFLFDPNLLMVFGSEFHIWEMRPETDRSLLQGVDLLVVPHAVSERDENLILDYFKCGGKLLWVRPSASALSQITNGEVAFSRTLKSHRERWNLPGGSFYYPQMLTYDQYENCASAGHWMIADSPSVVRFERATLCPGDLFFAHMWYMNSPLDTLSSSGELNAFQTLFAIEILHLLGKKVPEPELMSRFFCGAIFMHMVLFDGKSKTCCGFTTCQLILRRLILLFIKPLHF